MTLTVTDNEGAPTPRSPQVVVTTTPPGNQPPVASFTAICNSQVCHFANTSSDPDGTITTYAWDFGEPSSGANNTATTEDASHTYAAPG